MNEAKNDTSYIHRKIIRVYLYVAGDIQKAKIYNTMLQFDHWKMFSIKSIAKKHA